MKKLFFALLLLVNFSNAWALANGKCNTKTVFNPPIPTEFGYSGPPAADLTTAFFETVMTMDITCVGPMTPSYFNPTLQLYGIQYTGSEPALELYDFPGLSAYFVQEKWGLTDECGGILLGFIGKAESNTGYIAILHTGDGTASLAKGVACKGQAKWRIKYFTNGTPFTAGSASSTYILNGTHLGPSGNESLTLLRNKDAASSSTTGMNSFTMVSPDCPKASISPVTPFQDTYFIPTTPSMFVSQQFRIDLTCTPPINLDTWSGKSQLVIGVGNTNSPVQGGLTGVNARLANLVMDSSQTNCANNLGQQFDYTATTTTVSTPTLPAGTKFKGGTCTNHYIATVNYFTTGADFNTERSSNNLLTDTANQDEYTGFLRRGEVQQNKLQVQNYTSTFSMATAGRCAARINITDPANVNTLSPLGNSYKAVKSITNAPFLTKNVQILLTCSAGLRMVGGETHVVVGAGSAKSALLGGITGVQASMSTFTWDNNAPDSCPAAFANNFIQGATTTSIGTAGAFDLTLDSMGNPVSRTCTNTYNATLSYYATGADFDANKTSDLNLLTDKGVGYNSFLRAGTTPPTLAITSTGVNSFTLSNATCRVVLGAKVRAKK